MGDSGCRHRIWANPGDFVFVDSMVRPQGMTTVSDPSAI